MMSGKRWGYGEQRDLLYEKLVSKFEKFKFNNGRE